MNVAGTREYSLPNVGFLPATLQLPAYLAILSVAVFLAISADDCFQDMKNVNGQLTVTSDPKEALWLSYVVVLTFIIGGVWRIARRNGWSRRTLLLSLPMCLVVLVMGSAGFWDRCSCFPEQPPATQKPWFKGMGLPVKVGTRLCSDWP